MAKFSLFDKMKNLMHDSDKNLVRPGFYRGDRGKGYLMCVYVSAETGELEYGVYGTALTAELSMPTAKTLKRINIDKESLRDEFEEIFAAKYTELAKQADERFIEAALIAQLSKSTRKTSHRKKCLSMSAAHDERRSLW